MNTFRTSFAFLLLGGVLATQLQAQPLSEPLPAQYQQLAQNTPITNTPPVNNPIRRINPNSRQGTGASVPGASGQGIDNGKIGNGYPRNPPVPPTIKPTAPSLQPRDKP
ncbi:hypothetical protein GHN92_12595 [Pseudomonas sp. FSL R10-2964]|uniref:hypothetical protein n=1 Tax=Pseudomonas sp. FSL R10-2964 TaxID=2662202 RepID=UPI001295EC74|nr:hypothetical protein [Pseudomonas sp. FSL R10-2964]MQT85406.1 hypothetical protein [Pseudomonas sp. FSL R10-2964]